MCINVIEQNTELGVIIRKPPKNKYPRNTIYLCSNPNRHKFDYCQKKRPV